MQHDATINVSYESMSDALVQQLPELSGQYNELLGWWGDEKPAPHVVYGNVLNPYIEQVTRSHDVDALSRAFKLIERLSVSSDTRVRDVVAATICDFIVSNRTIFNQTRLVMGPSTRRQCEEVAKTRLV